jgi:hypothetical protein
VLPRLTETNYLLGILNRNIVSKGDIFLKLRGEPLEYSWYVFFILVEAYRGTGKTRTRIPLVVSYYVYRDEFIVYISIILVLVFPVPLYASFFILVEAYRGTGKTRTRIIEIYTMNSSR